MNDEIFLSQFETCILPKEHFNHRGHLRIAWLYLNQNTYEVALFKLTHGLRRYATSLNAAHIYHETLTRLWIYLVYKAITKKYSSFEDFIQANTELLNKSLPYQYYSTTLLDSEEARRYWIEPDLQPRSII